MLELLNDVKPEENEPDGTTCPCDGCYVAMCGCCRECLGAQPFDLPSD